jgi:hypothetical protein
MADAAARHGESVRFSMLTQQPEARRLSGDQRYSSIARLRATAIYLEIPEALAFRGRHRLPFFSLGLENSHKETLPVRSAC